MPRNALSRVVKAKVRERTLFVPRRAFSFDGLGNLVRTITDNLVGFEPFWWSRQLIITDRPDRICHVFQRFSGRSALRSAPAHTPTIQKKEKKRDGATSPGPDKQSQVGRLNFPMTVLLVEFGSCEQAGPRHNIHFSRSVGSPFRNN